MEVDHVDAEKYITPPALAKIWGVDETKITEFIAAGELKAVNLARRGCRNPRWKISPQAIADFERSRQPIPTATKATPRKRAQVKQYV